MKILISAFACDPTMGSEPYVGWNWTNLVKNIADVSVITRKQHKKNMQLAEGVSCFYFDLPLCSNLDHRHKLIKIYYILWQVCLPIYVLFGIRKKFDLFHHVTYNNIDVPGFLWLFLNKKFVWGPVGGGQTPPLQLKQYFYKSWRKQQIRAFLKRTAKYNPIVFLACWRATNVFVANKDTREKLPQIFSDKYIDMLETAIDIPPSICQGGSGWDLLWVGVVEERKALRLAIDIVGHLINKYDTNLIRLNVVGNGALYEEEREYAKTKSIPINFLGKVEYSEVRKLYINSDIFLFTSLQDTSGNVLLEAMAVGLPAFALNHQGAAFILKDYPEHLIKIDNTEAVIDNFSTKIFNFLQNKGNIEKTRKNFKKTCKRDFTWDSKLNIVKKVYSNEV